MKGIRTDRLYVYLGYLLLVTSLVTGVTFSRYSVTISNVESQNVMTLKTISGDFDVEIAAITEKNMFENQNPNMDEQEFVYSVNNKTDEDVTASIDITWRDKENKMNIPLEFEIYRGDKKIYPKKGKYKSSSIGLNKITIDDEIESEENVEYAVKWSWEEGKDGYVLAKKETGININVDIKPKEGNLIASKRFELVAKSSDFNFVHNGYSQTIGIKNNEAYIDLELANYNGNNIMKEDIKYYISIEDEYGENKKFDLKVDNIEYINDKTKESNLKGGKKQRNKRRIYFVVSPEAVDTLNVVENIRVKVTTVEPYMKESIFNVFVTNDSLIKFRLEDWFTVPLATRRLKFETDKSFGSITDSDKMLVKLNWDDGLDIDIESRDIKKNKGLEKNKKSIINGGNSREFYIETGPNNVIGIDFFENGVTENRGINVKTYFVKENNKLLHHTNWAFN